MFGQKKGKSLYPLVGAISLGLGAAACGGTEGGLGGAGGQSGEPGEAQGSCPDEDGDFICDEATVTLFDEDTWLVAPMSTGTVSFSEGGETVTLIDEEEFTCASAVILQEDLEPPFTIEMEVNTPDAEDPEIETGEVAKADGFAFFFGKDPGVFSDETPLPTGSSRGLPIDGTGYAVHFGTYPMDTIFVADGDDDVLTDEVITEIETDDDEWRPLRVDVLIDRIRVYVNGGMLIEELRSFDSDFAAAGIAAATGDSDSGHRVRNVRIFRGAR